LADRGEKYGPGLVAFSDDLGLSGFGIDAVTVE